MLAIFEKLRASKTETASDLRQKLAEVENSIPPALAAVRAIDAERAAGLLSMDDAALERIESRLAKARRDADRLAAARGEIERRLVDREAAERREPIEAAATAIEARAAAFAVGFIARYEEAAAPLAALMGEFAEIEEHVSAVNGDMLDLHRSLGTLNGMPAPVRTVSDRISGGRSAHSVFLAATRIVATAGQPGFPADR